MRRRLHKSEDLSFSHNAIVQWLLIATGFTALIAIGLLLSSIHPSTGPLKLQYNIYFGASVIGEWWSSYLLSIIGLIFVSLDLVVAYVLYHVHERIASYMVLLGGFFVHVGLIIAILSIILNNR